MIREDLSAQKAIALVADEAKPIPLAEAEDRKGKAEAKEKLLAPEALADFARYLQSPNLAETVVHLPEGTRALFQRVFGARHFSLRALACSEEARSRGQLRGRVCGERP